MDDYPAPPLQLMNAKQNSALSAFNHKSSVLCPSSTHITSQYLALEQLKAHHNMLSRAKGSVDTSAPKSLQSFISGINRRKKSYWNPELQYPSALNQFSRHRRSSSCDGDSREILNTQDEHFSTSLNKSIQTAAPFPEFQSKVADKISWYLEAVNKAELQPPIRQPGRGSRNERQHAGSPLSLSSSLRSGRIVKGDLMEWHKNSFTAVSRPFSPRILVNNSAKSKVSAMKCYNPPRKRRQKNSVNSSDTYESFEDDDDDNNKADDEKDDIEEEEESQTHEEFEEESGSDIEDDKIEEKIEVDISIEKKNIHEEWLKEQALRAQIRRKLRDKTRGHGRNIPIRARHFRKESANAGFNPHFILTKEEEDKYLKFLCEVTEDILRSGIYTDNAIERTFQFHLQLCSKDADKEKLQHLFAQVLSGLQLPIEAHTHMSTSNQMLIKSANQLFSDAAHNEENINLLNNVLERMDISNTTFPPHQHCDSIQDETTANLDETLTIADSQVLEESMPLEEELS